VALHDGDVQRITRGQPDRGPQDPSPALDILALDRMDDVDDAEQGLERGVDELGTPDRRVAMEDLLEHLGIGAQDLPARDGILEQAPRPHLLRLISADQVHRDAGVDEDHGIGASSR
jgi:hypothetical protein